MKIPNATPGEGARYAHDHFNNWSVKPGERHFAWYAGGAQWFVCHPSDRGTKPCLHWMTKGKLGCRFCGINKVPCQLGYAPMWRAVDIRPLFVIVYEEEREWIEKLELHDRVQIGREKDAGARIWVRVSVDQEPKFQTTLLRRTVKQDITASLLRLWRMPELVAWLTGSSDNAVSLPPTVEELPDVPDTRTKAVDLEGIARNCRFEEAKALAKAEQAKKNAEWCEKHRNGNGKPKPKG